jgi:hypothetical protein
MSFKKKQEMSLAAIVGGDQREKLDANEPSVSVPRQSRQP